jgi:hypothetical protein
LKSIYINLFLGVAFFVLVLTLQKYRNDSAAIPSVTPSANALGVATQAPQKAGPFSIYPNPELTPGEVFPDVTTDQICTSGYSSKVRHVPESEKKKVFGEYGISLPQPVGSYEVDHFISLELGGDNSLENLWPEPSEPRPGFHEKDRVENYLHKEVCDGKISLIEAQNEIKTDWYKVYLSMAITP